MVAYVYIPSYVGDWDWEDHGSKPAMVKSLRPHLNKKKLAVGGHACQSSDGGKCKIGFCSAAWEKKQDPISKITRAKKAGGLS
jgi:hypothetical protein